MRREIRRALRALMRSPGFTAIAAVTMAIGIGATATTLGVVDAAFFRRLPVPDADRMIAVYARDAREPRRKPSRPVSFPEYEDLKRMLRGVDGLAAAASEIVSATELSESLSASFVSANFFSVAGVRPVRGRFIAESEVAAPGMQPVVVISERLWRTRFGADNAALGRTLVLSGSRFTIIGVASEGFNGVQPEARIDLWLPYTMQGEATGRAFQYDERLLRRATVFGRLQPGATIERVQTSANDVAKYTSETYAAVDSAAAFRVAPRSTLVNLSDAPHVFVSMLLVVALVGLVHLVACGNVATLLLIRSAAQRRDLGIQMCFGASQRHIVRQALSEPAILSVAGAAMGLGIVVALSRVVAQSLAFSALAPSVDLRILSIVAAISVATALQSGLLPAVLASRLDPIAVLSDRPESRIFGLRLGPSSLLIVSQMAVTVTVVNLAAVLLRAQIQQSDATLGAEQGIMIVEVDVPRRTSRGERTSLVDRTLARLAAMPGIEAAAVSSGAPLYRSNFPDRVRPWEADPWDQRSASVQRVGHGYFRALGVGLLRGREFTPAEALDGDARGNRQRLVIVNQQLARHLWSAEDPIGRGLVVGANDTPATIIGIVPDLHDVSAFETLPRAYFPTLGEGQTTLQFVVRARSSGAVTPLALVDVVGREWASADRPRTRSMHDLRQDATETTRAAGTAAALCAAVTILLSALGLYGLVSAWVEQRRRDIAIRLALGARSRHLYGLIFGAVARMIALGLILGSLGGYAAVRLGRASLGAAFEAQPTVVVIATVSFMAIAAISVFLPSYRVHRMAPGSILKR